MISPIMIACGERFTKNAKISISSFLKYHNDKLFVVVNDNSLSEFNDRVNIVQVHEYVEFAKDSVNCQEFATIKRDDNTEHDRTYSALKVLIMDGVIRDHCPESKYILSLDSDTIFTGDILKRTRDYLKLVNHEFDIYMIRRADPRMCCARDFITGSGYTLWKQNCDFIKLFISNFTTQYAGHKNGGSQPLINKIKTSLLYHEIDDPFLHFISPDRKNPNITDEEISKIKPAYIHLHGMNSYSRLLRFSKIFDIPL